MSAFVRSLRILYTATPKRVTLEKLQTLLADGKITQAEYEWIIA